MGCQIAPREDEVKALARYAQGGEARAMLSPPEAFLATMSTVPRLMDKINLLILIQQFEVLPCASTNFLHVSSYMRVTFLEDQPP